MKWRASGMRRQPSPSLRPLPEHGSRPVSVVTDRNCSGRPPSRPSSYSSMNTLVQGQSCQPAASPARTGLLMIYVNTDSAVLPSRQGSCWLEVACCTLSVVGLDLNLEAKPKLGSKRLPGGRTGRPAADCPACAPSTARTPAAVAQAPSPPATRPRRDSGTSSGADGVTGLGSTCVPRVTN